MTGGTQHNPILWFFLIVFVISIVLLVLLLWPFISIIVLGAVVSGVFKPVYNRLNRRLRRSPASLLTCCLIFLVLFVPIVTLVSLLSTEAYGLYETAKGSVLGNDIQTLFQGSRLNTFLSKHVFVAKYRPVLSQIGLDPASKDLQRALSEVATKIGLILYEQASAIASNILSFFFNFFLMLLVTYYLLIDGGQLIAFIENLTPLPLEQSDTLVQKFRDMAFAILIGSGLGGVIQGTLGGMVFALFNLTSPLLWGVIMALSALLPIIGIGVVFIPASIYLFLIGRVGAGIFFIVFYLVLTVLVDNVLKPKLVGDRVRMHTLLVFLSILGGVRLFGVLGIIYGPLIVTAFITLTDIYYSSYQRLITPPPEARDA
jgi:predicted PurR-regulated permease PerM